MKQADDKLAKRQQQKFSWTAKEFKATFSQDDKPNKSQPSVPQQKKKLG